MSGPAKQTKVSKKEFIELASEYGLPRLTGARLVADEPNQRQYLLETAKGKFVVKFEAAKSEMELKRELDLMLFLRKHGFPCFAPLADRRGRHYREQDGAFVVAYRHIDGRSVNPSNLSAGQLENAGRVLADLHLVGKAYKKGVDNRFAFERIADIYLDARGRLPHYFKRIVRTFDEEVEYLKHYLESKLPKGIIHGDLFPDKMRFKGD
jgi:homoserine kinase type II